MLGCIRSVADRRAFAAWISQAWGSGVCRTHVLHQLIERFSHQ